MKQKADKELSVLINMVFILSTEFRACVYEDQEDSKEIEDTMAHLTLQQQQTIFYKP